MKLVLVAPFRVRFDLNKPEILTRLADWTDAVHHARSSLGSGDFPGGKLGNYAWGQLREFLEQEQIVYGETGVGDPTWFFKDYFVLSMSDDWRSGVDGGWRERATWEARIIDNTLGLLVVRQELPVEAFLEELTEGNDLGAYGNGLVRRILKEISPILRRSLAWLETSLLGVAGLGRKKRDRSLFLGLGGPIYALPDREAVTTLLWVHETFVMSRKEKAEVKKHRALFDGLFPTVVQDQLGIWWEQDEDLHGWGGSAIHVGEGRADPAQWLDAVCVSQFYYACFDIVDTSLPVEIARQQVDADRHKLRSVLDSATFYRHAVATLRLDYDDVRVRCSGEAYRALAGYHENWRFERLLGGLERKTRLLEELVSSVSDTFGRSNQERIQYILNFIAILSIVGLFASVHDYLSAAYDPRTREVVPEIALSLSRVAVLSISIVVALLAFLAYVLFNRKR